MLKHLTMFDYELLRRVLVVISKRSTTTLGD